MDFEFKEKYNLKDLERIMEILCDKDTGCEWDKVQTHRSIRQNFIEEVYEAVDAIDKDDKDLMKEELGDVLLQVVYHCYFEARQNNFTIDDVIDGVAKKMVMRHPNIFRPEEYREKERRENRWEKIKNQSHGHNTITQTLQAVPGTFPALMYAQKVQKRVEAGGVKLPDIRREIEILRGALDKIERDLQEDGVKEKDLSQLLFSSVNLARQCKSDAEEILSKKNGKFVKNFAEFEKIALQNHEDFGTIDFAVIKKIWTQE